MRGKAPDRFRTLFLRTSDTSKPIAAWIVKILHGKVVKTDALELFPGASDQVRITLQPRKKPGDIVSHTVFRKAKPRFHLERTDDDGDVLAVAKAIARGRAAVINDGWAFYDPDGRVLLDRNGELDEKARWPLAG